jgi:endonuclease/exonuclease/phosphatase (EEP) superfamily protein YafD
MTDGEPQGTKRLALRETTGFGRWSRGTWLWYIYDLFAFLMIVYIIASQYAGNAIWPIKVLAYVSIFVIPIAFVLLPIALIKGRRVGPVLQIICAIAFVLILVDTRAEDRGVAPPSGTQVVTVLTYNIGDGLAPADRLIPMLRESGADIVGLVEVTSEIARALETDLGDLFPYQVVRGAGIEGKALLSRFPIAEHEWLEFNPGRPDLRVDMLIEQREVTVIVAHPPPPEITWRGIRERPGTEQQLARILELVEQSDQPLLLLGDFNITRQHDVYDDIVSTGLQDTFHIAGSGFGFTLPARLMHLQAISQRLADIRIQPVARIDYIWASPAWLTVDSRVGADAGSDHLPVVSVLALPPPT